MSKLTKVVLGIGVSYPLLGYVVSQIGVYPTSLIMFLSAALTLRFSFSTKYDREDFLPISISAGSFVLLVYCAGHMSGISLAAICGLKPFIDIALDKVFFEKDRITKHEWIGTMLVVASSLLMLNLTGNFVEIEWTSIVLGSAYIMLSSTGQALRLYQSNKNNGAASKSYYLPSSLMLGSVGVLALCYFEQGYVPLLKQQIGMIELSIVVYLGVITTGVLAKYCDDLRKGHGLVFVQLINSSHAFIAAVSLWGLHLYLNQQYSADSTIFLYSLTLYLLGIGTIIFNKNQRMEKAND